jgi:sialic acid synthase SpsE
LNTILITDIGNCHFGSIEDAKELIYQSKQNGADLVKGQAFKADGIHGSMSKDFYRQCQFDQPMLIELMDYADEIKIPLFFTIYSIGFDIVMNRQKYQKIAAVQSIKLTNTEIENWDNDNMFISINWERIDNCHIDPFPKMKKAAMLFASNYLSSKYVLPHLNKFKFNYNRYGYSDHTLGIENCIKAVELFGAHVIEKHICLENNKEFKGMVFRDTIHGVTPKEIYNLAKRIK